MKTTLTKSQLLSIMAPVVGGVGRTTPILSTVLLQAHSYKIEAITNNMERQTRAYADYEGDDFICCVDAKKLFDIVKTAKADIEINLTDKNLSIKSGSARYMLKLSDPDEFPLSEKGEIIGYATCSQPELLGAIRSTINTAADNDVRFFLNGLLLDFNECLDVVSSNGIAISKKIINFGGDPMIHQSIIPKQTVSAIEKILTGEGTCRLSVMHNQISIEAENVEMIARLIDEKYPNYQMAIPSSTDYKQITVNNETMIDAIRSVSIISSEKMKLITVSVDGNSMRLSGINEKQEESSDVIEIEYDGDAFEFTSQIQYLINALSSGIKSELRYYGERSPIIIENDAFYVVMPVVK